MPLLHTLSYSSIDFRKLLATSSLKLTPVFANSLNLATLSKYNCFKFLDYYNNNYKNYKYIIFKFYINKTKYN